MMSLSLLFNKDRYQLVYDDVWHNTPRYMLFKRVGFWYFPLKVKTPFDFSDDVPMVYGYYIEATSIKLISLYFKKGALWLGSKYDLPTWYNIGVTQDRLIIEYYNDYDDFLNKKAEYMV